MEEGVKKLWGEDGTGGGGYEGSNKDKKSGGDVFVKLAGREEKRENTGGEEIVEGREGED